MKAKECILVVNAPKTGHIFTPIECKSIASALRTARGMGFPYRLFDKGGKLVRRGWLVE